MFSPILTSPYFLVIVFLGVLDPMKDTKRLSFVTRDWSLRNCITSEELLKLELTPYKVSTTYIQHSHCHYTLQWVKSSESFIPGRTCMSSPWKWSPGNEESQRSHSMFLLCSPFCQSNTRKQEHLLLSPGDFCSDTCLQKRSQCKLLHNINNDVWEVQFLEKLHF